jgi:hypothetical protein
MTIAEIHGKLPSEFENKEDLLTSDVFGTLKNIDRQMGLGNFLRCMNIPFSKDELENTEFLFWEEMENGKIKRIPDVIIKTSSKLIFVEAKYKSPIDEKQLEDEYKIGVDQGHNFYLVCVTDGFEEPSEIKDIGKKLNTTKIKWISWQKILEILKDGCGKMDEVSKRYTEDLVKLMEHKGLRRFRGFEKDWIDKIIDSRSSFEKFYEEIYLFVKELTESLDEKGIKHTYNEGLIERDGTSTAKNWKKWITRYIEACYKGKEWEELSSWRDAYLYVEFDLKKPVIWVGYDVNVCDEKKNISNGSISEVYKSLQKYDNSYIFLREGSDPREVKISDTNSKDFKKQISSKYKSVDICLQIPIEKVILVDVIKYIIEFKKLVDDYKIYPCILKK